VGSLRAKLIDRNRYSKRYPFVKGPKRISYLGNSDLSIELGSLTFNNESEKLFKFEASFSDTQYTVIAIPREVSIISDGSAMVSLAIDGLNISRSQVKIKASAKFTGKVDVFAVKVS
jgi:hypothetical protein